MYSLDGLISQSVLPVFLHPIGNCLASQERNTTKGQRLFLVKGFDLAFVIWAVVNFFLFFSSVIATRRFFSRQKACDSTRNVFSTLFYKIKKILQTELFSLSRDLTLCPLPMNHPCSRLHVYQISMTPICRRFCP